MSTFRDFSGLQVQLRPFSVTLNPPTMLLTSASSSSCCVAASRSLRIHSFHDTGQSQSSIQAAQAKREGKRSAPCWAVTPEEGTEKHEEERVSRNPAHMLGLGKEELEFCMSSVITRKTDGNRHPIQHKPGCHQMRGREQMSPRSSAGSVLGKSEGS